MTIIRFAPGLIALSYHLRYEYTLGGPSPDETFSSVHELQPNFVFGPVLCVDCWKRGPDAGVAILVERSHKSFPSLTVWVDITFNTHPLAYFWKGDVEKLMGKGKPLEQPMGFKLPPSGTPPYVPQGNRWKQSAAKSSAASAGSFIGQRPPPPMIPKG